MDFKDLINQFSLRIPSMLDRIQTEESTKNALVMPFLQILGYDVFNPHEVNPEFTADLGLKKGEKVDYAIMRDNEPIMLFECKHHLAKLESHNSQLFRYFHTSKARFGILTNGLIYEFYSDLKDINKMDTEPFFIFNILDMKDSDIDELKKYQKSYFDEDSILLSANELKYMNGIRKILQNELKQPSENFVKLFTSQIYNGRSTTKVLSYFNVLVKKSINSILNEMLNDRLKNAMKKDEQPELIENIEENNNDCIITTDEEKDAFFIVKSILREKIDGKRVFGRDKKSYYGINLDDNNRKIICRLWFNSTKKYIGLLDINKIETKYEIVELDDIYKYKEELLKIVDFYKE